MKINYVKGNAVEPIRNDNEKVVIVHICNNIGAWGSGFVKAVSAKWSKPEQVYRSIPKDKLELGNVEFINVEDNIYVANLIGQDSIRYDNEGKPPIRYGAIENGLFKIYQWASDNNATIHMPRIGCGLAGGKWSEIEKIIQNVTSVINEINTTVYDFEDTSNSNFVKANLD